MEVTSFFRHSLDLMLFSDAAEKQAGPLKALNIHWDSGTWAEQYPDIQNPWRYCLMNGTAPSAMRYQVPPSSARLGGRSIVIFPERSDNGRLDDDLFAGFIRRAHALGYQVYTNCYLNSNYVTSPAIPGTLPLAQVSLCELIAIASDPTNIIVGNRSGVFDILFFALPKVAARLLVLYPADPPWLWSVARFQNDRMQREFPHLYATRSGLLELRTQDFGAEALTVLVGG